MNIKATGLMAAAQLSFTVVADPAPANVHLVPESYPSIQAAIDAAENIGGTQDVILIAPGDYHEQLLIKNKSNLVLSARSTGVVLHATSDLLQTLTPANNLRPMVGLVRSSVTLRGLTFAGDEMGSVYSSGALQGVFYLASTGIVENCIFRDFRGSTLTEYSSARGLVLHNPGSAGGPREISIQVISNTFSGNETSIAIGGDDVSNPTALRTRFLIEGNTFIGLGEEPLAIDGLIIYTGASGVVRRNTFRDFNYTATDTGDIPFSSGVLAHDGWARNRSPRQAIPLKTLRFEENTFLDNDEHLVALGAHRAEIVNNVFTGTGPILPRWGGLTISGTNVLVANNNFADMPMGLYLFGTDDVYADNWPSVGIPHNLNLRANWFSNVTERVHVPPVVTGLQEEGTEQPPFRPLFQSIGKNNSGLNLILRRWHSQSLLIEGSTDLHSWTAVYQDDTSSPVLEYIETNPPGRSRFYRARNK